MKAHFSHVQWGKVLWSSILLVILVVILYAVLLAVIGFPSTSWSTSILAILLTVGGAVWVARKVESEAPLHGFLVGLVAALILLVFNPSVTTFLQGTYPGRLGLLVLALGTFFLMVAAGWLGGILGSRGRENS
jgi:hypothetical protein